MPWQVAVIGGHSPFQQRLLAGVRRFFWTTDTDRGWELWGDCPGILGSRHVLEAKRIAECPVDGVLYVGAHTPADGGLFLNIFKRMPIPVVCATLFVAEGPRPPCVVPDDEAAGRSIAAHLLNKGFQNFAFYGIEDNSPVTSARERGFIAEIRAHGYDVRMHRSPLSCPTDRIADMFCQLHEWVRSLPIPVGVGACSDTFALGLLQGCRKLRIRVPEQVAVVGIGNDINICDATVPPLSSADPDLIRIGHEAASMLDNLLNGREVPSQIVRISPRCVVERDSTSQGPIGDLDVAKCVHYIHLHSANRLKIDCLADHVHLSMRTLQARFKKAIGKNPGQVIRDGQIERAVAMLRQTDWPITQIAMACGFSSQSHFNIAFKRRMGLPPNKYRRKGKRFKSRSKLSRRCR